MSSLTHRTTRIPGVLELTRPVFGDSRGWFGEVGRVSEFAELGIPPLLQDNLSRSDGGVLRGLHYQISQPQGHLITVVEGTVFDVAVDLRPNSPAFGQVETFELTHTDSLCRQVWLPPGVAHGFCVLSSHAVILYKCSDYYRHGDEGGLLWNDLDLRIPWPLSAPRVNQRDAAFPCLKAIPRDRLPRV